MKKRIQFIFLLLIAIVAFGCKHKKAEALKEPNYKDWKSVQVSATAYNSAAKQIEKDNVVLTAWGDTLKPDMKAIAVSRDLIKKGFVHNTSVKIEGLKGFYVVKDKMNRRWKKKIDIYFGTDVQKARNWGKKKVTVYVEGGNKD